jgi:hypothetical protein
VSTRQVVAKAITSAIALGKLRKLLVLTDPAILNNIDLLMLQLWRCILYQGQGVDF